MTIRLKVTQERFNEIVDLADSFNLFAVSVSRAYEYICQFVVREDGEYATVEEAQGMFRAGRIKRAAIAEYWTEFVVKVNEAFVNPPSAEPCDKPS